MKKSKKLISIILSLAILIGVLTTVLVVTANAKETTVNITVGKAELVSGESTTVSVSLTSNYPIATMSIPVFYDKTMVNVSNAVATINDYSVANAVIDSESADASKIYANTDISEEKFGFVLVNYIGSVGADVPESINDVVLTFEITAKMAVSGNAVVKCVAESQKTEENIEGMLYFGSPVSGNTIDSIPENIENVDLTGATESVKIASGGTQFSIIEGTTAVIDEESKYVYGITAGDEVENYFKVTNGTMEILPSPGGATNGTGAVINVKNSSGEILDSYTVIIFGDVNGDGEISGLDYGNVKTMATGGEIIENKISRIAIDINGDGEVSGLDYGLIKTAATGGDKVTVNPYV